MEWRAAGGAFSWLRDDQDLPSESLLQSIWLHQRLRRAELITIDGTPVRVLHPGFLSLEGGPDFQSAVVMLGDGPSVCGDIEVDLRSNGWRAHGHDKNPAFANVVLHVVWDQERSPMALPTLPLRKVLDAPLGELNQWLTSGAARVFPENNRGVCSGEVASWPGARIEELLIQAAVVRLRAKASQFQARARQAGWEQALWEGVFRALGYKHNTWPMQTLAELKPRWQGSSPGAFQLEARLLGIAGLLPADLSRPKAGTEYYLRRLWDQWWRELGEFSDCILPRQVWRFHGIRPANHPQRRVALAAQWSHSHDLSRILEDWCAESIQPREEVTSIETRLSVPAHEFWSRHCTLRSPLLPRPQPLMGGTRVTDLAINVFIPWLWARLSESGKPGLSEQIEQRYLRWPAGQDNSVLRQARQRVLGGNHSGLFCTAAAQQGLMQIAQDFCGRSNSVCEGCRMPGLLRAASISEGRDQPSESPAVFK